MIKAQLIEKYVNKDKSSRRRGIERIVHETRYFSSKDKFHEWFETFKEDLWECDPDKVDLIEGIYVETEEITVDNTSKPDKVKLRANFRKGISYKYAS